MEAELLFFVAVAVAEVFGSCKPKDVKLSKFDRKQKRGIGFLVSLTAVKCPGLDDFYYEWKIKEVPGNRIVYSDKENNLLLFGYDFYSEDIFEKTYEIIGTVSHYPDMTYSSSASQVIEFIPDKMTIRIFGGSEKTHLANTKLVIDALKFSRDPSYHPREDEFAGNSVSWKITPKIENYTAPEKMKIEVPGQFLKLGTNYNFTITVTRTKIPKYIDKQSATQVVRIISDKDPEINIKCTRNCLNPHYLEPTAFAVECSRNCKDLNYKWSVSPTVDPKKIEFGNGYDKLLVREMSFKEGSSVKVVVESGRSRSAADLQFISGITKGDCSIYPKEGVSGVTKFKVKCTGFSSPYGIAVYMIYQLCDDVPGGVLLNEEHSKEENEVYLTVGAPTNVRIVVQDNAYLIRWIELPVQVKPFSPPGDKSKIETIKKMVLNHDFFSISAYAIEGFSNEVVEMISLLLNAIKECKEMDNSTVKDLHKHMAESLLRSKLQRFTSSIQFVSILMKLQKFKLESDTLTSRYIGKSMVSAAFTAYKMHSTEEEFSIPQFFLNSFINDSLQLASEQLKSVEEIKLILTRPTPAQDYDSYDEYVSEKLRIRDDLRSLVTDVIISVQTNGIVAIYKNIPDQKEIFFESELIYFTTRRVLLSSLMRNQTIGVPSVTNSKIFIPRPLIEELQKKSDHVDYQFGVFKKNPFWWHTNSSSFNAEFILFDLFRGSKKIKSVENPFYVHLQTENIPKGKLNGSLAEKNVGAHRIDVEPGVMLVAVFEASDETYTVTSSDCFCKPEDFSRGIAIRNGTNDSQRTLVARSARDAEFIYVCVMKSGRKLNYEGSFSVFSCAYWNGRNGKWESDGCEIQNAGLQNSSQMVCKCSHFSLFSGQILVAPNSLNLEVDIDFTIAFLENKLMVIIVATLLLLWFFALILAHLKDRDKKKKNVVYKLDDIVPGDEHVYLVVVFTGFFFDAGTTADVAFQLIGDQAKSRIHLMRCKDVVLLKRNSQDWFVIFTPFYLGNLKKIKIWHNSKGNKPHWYCLRIIVQDLKSGQQYCFSVNKWFSVVWGNGKTYHEIHGTEINMLTRKQLFTTQFENNMKDKYLWMSIVTRDTQSNFNSKERVSCAFCFIFLSMLASAMFYGVPRGVPSDSIDQKTNYSITLFHFVVLIESWLVAGPISMAILLLFKNSAPRSK